MHFIIKFFPEITIKTPPVRKRFIKQLRHNLKRLLSPLSQDIQLRQSWDKMEVIAADDSPELSAQVATVLANTPGIAYFAEVSWLEFSNLEDLGRRIVPVWGPALEGKTFCVRAKRSGKQDFTSHDIERAIGAALNQAVESARVKLVEPQITVKLEVIDQQCFVFLNQRPGLGGFPLGTQDAVLSLMSGGFDSTVASYLMMKRGLLAHFCFFNLGGRAHELGVKEVSYFLWRKFGASHPVKFVSIPFEAVVTEILEKIHHSQMGVVLKRMMLRVATQVAADMGIQALITGESVAQVASQTLTNLGVIDGVTDTLVLRPLIAMDKGDIISLSRRIGTEEFAAAMPEYCGVISVKPTTRASRERIEREEENFDFSCLEHAFQSRKVISIASVADDVGPETTAVRIETEAGQGAVIIDIRHPDEEERKPLEHLPTTIKKIPFYRLNAQFAQLPSDQHYLLYCDRGVMSQLHAAHLSEAGFSNVGVYRPAGEDKTPPASTAT